HIAARPAGDGADAPDPGASAGHRESGGRRPGIRACRALWPAAPVPARRKARVRASCQRGNLGPAVAAAGGPREGPPAGVRGTSRSADVGEAANRLVGGSNEGLAENFRLIGSWMLPS